TVLGSAPVARVWNTKLTPPADREAALRHTLGAQVLVGGSLRRLTTDMYELTVQVTLRADNQAQKMTLTGAKPARLAVDAAKRVRGILLPHQPSEAVTSALADKFFAEAYSRGMDLIHQGKMAQARTYFELCVRSAPDFLPAQLQLGESQFHTRQITQARKTLNDLVALAQKHADPGMTAQALNRLSAVDMAEQKFAAALTHAQKALTFAQRCKDKKIEAISTLHIANAASRLGKLDMAGHNLAHAHSLVERFGLKSLSPTLYNAEAFYAMARGDSAAREVADRASLRYSEATGNEANALSARYNVATDMIAQGRGTAAIPLLHKVYVDAMARQNTNLGWYAGYTLVAQLFVGGADQQALALVEKLLPITTSNKQTAKHWMTLALRGSVEAYRDDLEASLHSYRQALPLVDAKQSPGNVMQLLQYMAQAAYFVDPAALPRIAGKADAIHGAQAASLDYSWHLLHALVDAQAGRQAQSMVHMRTAAGAAHPNDPQQSDLRSVAFSLAKASKVAAAMALKDFDINQCSNAATLHDYARWAQTQGDTAGQQRAQDRIAALRKLTLSALSSGALAAVHKPPATHG
ncbi:MAG: hypothetical protein L0H70_07480, partial [Xanthomonadales bacterium]|nr:hypothetical protein [Xanthomonadales bacterium]